MRQAFCFVLLLIAFSLLAPVTDAARRRRKSCSAVDGGWGDYFLYWECDVCGGTSYYIRYCNNPYPSCGGASCSGSYYTSTVCDNPCNDGSCYSTGSKDYFCTCPAGVYGLNCENQYTVCESNEYESVAGTTTTDRKCETITECDFENEFEIAGPTATTDRVCGTLTVCDAQSQYEIVPKTTTSDRECKTATPECDYTHEYESVPLTTTSDRTCSSLTVCSYPSLYETVSATTTTNRQCSTSTVCDYDTQYESPSLTPTSDRVCNTLTVCDDVTEYQTVAASTTSNRQCESLTTCDFESQYESIPATHSSNRECISLTLCSLQLNEFEAVAPTLTSNRECGTVTECATGFYEEMAPTVTSDRSCLPIGLCNPGEYESQPATVSSNRVCSTYTECVDHVEYESTSPTATSNRVCATYTVCDLSLQYESVVATKFSDRQCDLLRVCLSEEEYESIPATRTTNRECSSITTCVEGEEYEAVAPTATSNRECLPYITCDFDVEYESVPATSTSNRECLPLAVCELGVQYETTPASETSNRVCEDVSECVAGHQYETSSYSATSDRVCVDLTECLFADNKFETVAPTSTSDRVCENLTACLLGDGKFESTPATATSDRECSDVITCVAGEYEKVAPTATSNRECSSITACTEHQWLSVAATTTSDNVCEPLTFCTSGVNSEWESTAPTATSNRVCTPHTICTDNQFRSVVETHTSDRTCQDFRVCTAEEFELVAPNYNQNRECEKYHVAPSFAAAKYEVVIDRNTPVSSEILSIGYTEGDIPSSFVFQLSDWQPVNAESSSTPETWFSFSGENLSLSSALPEGVESQLITLTLKAVDDRQECVLSDVDRTYAPCSASVTIVIALSSLINCPSEVLKITQETEAQDMTWDDPLLNSLLVGASLSSTLSPRAFDVGEEATAMYTALPAGLIPLFCTFQVKVSYGVEEETKNVGKFFSAHQNPPLHYYISDMDGFYGGGSQILPFIADVKNQGFTYVSVAPVGEMFNIKLTAALEYQFEVEMSFCALESFPAESEMLPAHTHVVLGGASQTVTFTSNPRSAINDDGTCFRMSAKSNRLSIQTLSFRSVQISFTHSLLGEPLLRRRAVSSFSFIPFAPSVHRVSFYELDDLVLLEDPGNQITVEDNDPPTWVNCPTTITVEIFAGSNSARAVWSEPSAVDNVGVVRTEQTHESNSSFTFADSPHLVTYSAFDAANYKGECSFFVFVEFDGDSLSLNKTVAAADIGTYYVSNEFGNSVFSDLMIHSDAGKINITADLGLYTAISIDVLPPFGERYSLNMGSDTSAVNGRLEINMLWVNSGQSLTALPIDGSDDTYIKIEFEDLRDGNDDDFDFPLKWFETTALTAVVSGASPYIRMTGHSSIFSQSVTFSSMRVTLYYPLGRSSGIISELTPTDNSYIRFAYFYTDNPADLPIANPSLRLGKLAMVDLQPPEFANCPATALTFFVDAGRAYATATWADVGASDNQNLLFVTNTHTSGDLFNITGSSTPERVVYVAHDSMDNTANCEFDVIVLDNEFPAVACPDDSVYEAGSGLSYSDVNASDVAPKWSSDNHEVILTVPDARQYIGENSVEIIASDPSGNSVSCTYTITVLDLQPPVITFCQSDIYRMTSVGNTEEVIAWSNPLYTDNDDYPTLTSSHAQPFSFPIGVAEVVQVVRDRSGNEVNCTFSVTVEAAPTIDTAASATSSVGTSSTTVIGAGVGATLLVVILLVLAIKLRIAHLKNKKMPHDFEELMAQLQAMPGFVGDYDEDGGPKKPREIERSAVKKLDRLGKGNFGEVHKGLLAEHKGQAGYLVAIKSLHEGVVGSDMEELLRESAIMAQFEHDHVVKLIGVCTVGEPMMAVLEFCEHGALNSYLQKNDLTNRTLFVLAGDCSEGLAYLTSRGFVHRDVAARNVLVSSERRGKLADFGMSRDTENHEYYQSRGGQIPVRWTAPEALEDQKFSAKSDCWSFGVLLYELWTQARLPYKGWTNQKVWMEVTGGFRLPCPKGCPSSIHERMLECWQRDPIHRPEFSELAAFFRNGSVEIVAQDYDNATEEEGGESNYTDPSDTLPKGGHMLATLSAKANMMENLRNSLAEDAMQGNEYANSENEEGDGEAYLDPTPVAKSTADNVPQPAFKLNPPSFAPDCSSKLKNDGTSEFLYTIANQPNDCVDNLYAVDQSSQVEPAPMSIKDLALNPNDGRNDTISMLSGYPDSVGTEMTSCESVNGNSRTNSMADTPNDANCYIPLSQQATLRAATLLPGDGMYEAPAVEQLYAADSSFEEGGAKDITFLKNTNWNLTDTIEKFDHEIVLDENITSEDKAMGYLSVGSEVCESLYGMY